MIARYACMLVWLALAAALINLARLQPEFGAIWLIAAGAALFCAGMAGGIARHGPRPRRR